MLSPFIEIVRTWLFIMVASIVAVNVLALSGEKRFDLKIGFDLTQGDNGAPSLRIRDFEDSAKFVQRAHDDDDGTKEVKQTVKDTTGESIEPGENIKPDSSKESSGRSDDDNEYSEEQKLSTRGLKAAEYEPEDFLENAEEIHGRYHGSDDDSDKRRYHRRKRNALYLPL